MIDVNERAWSLYRQIEAQRARLKSYEEALAFVRIRQGDAPETVRPVAKALWAIACQSLVGKTVKLSTGQPCPKRGKWVIQTWMVENGEGRIEEVGPDYICVAIERRSDGSPIVGYKRTQVIPHETGKPFTITPIQESNQ